MLDTASKERGSLREIMDADRLAAFLTAVREYQLAAGLAGSLRLADIAPLTALGQIFWGSAARCARTAGRGSSTRRGSWPCAARSMRRIFLSRGL